MKSIKIIMASLCVVMLFFISEVLYVANHPDIFNDYILKTARGLSSLSKTDIAFYVLTKGKIQLPSDPNYKVLVSSYLKESSQKYDLPRIYYDLALASYTNNEKSLTPELLGLSIDIDPDFSFWRVELANYYLSIGQPKVGRKVLDDCMTKEYPKKHCEDYLNNSFNNNQINNVGFLEDSVKKFYELRSN